MREKGVSVSDRTKQREVRQVDVGGDCVSIVANKSNDTAPGLKPDQAKCSSSSKHDLQGETSLLKVSLGLRRRNIDGAASNECLAC